MGYPRTTPLKWLPASADGVTVTSGGPNWANGAFVEVSAAMAADSQLAAISVGVTNIGAVVIQVAIDVAVGGAGVETVIATRRLMCFGNGGAGEGALYFAVPIDLIPAGSRVSIRARDQDSATYTLATSIGYYENLDSAHVTAYPCLEVPANASGVSVTPSGTAWVSSAWAELTSGIPSQIEIAALCGYQSLASFVEYELDVATGGAGAETLITTLPARRSPGQSTNAAIGPFFPRPYTLPASTRIALRIRTSNTNAAVWPMSAEYYADPLVTADPTVETLPAVAVRSTQARIRGRIDPDGQTFTGRFAWGLEGSPLALDTETVSQAIGSGTLFVTYNALLTGLTPSTTYYYRAIGNDGSDDFFGDILSFTTSGEHEFIDGEVSYPLAWLELTKRDGDMKPFAEVDLNDAPSYYGGYKAPWVKRFFGITRGLSDRDGQIEHLTFGALFADTVRYFRELLADVVNKYLTNRPLVERFIDDEDRRVEGLPRIAAVGFVNDYAPREDLQFELKGADWLKKKYSRKRQAQQSWQPLILAEDFPECPEETVNTPAPVIYGSLGLSGADPVEDVQITVNAQPAAAPASFAITTVAGGRYAGVTRYYIVSAIVAGQETQQAGPLVETTDNTNRTIRLTWSAVPGATAINVYSSHRADFAQFYYQTLAGGATTLDDDTTPIDDADRAPWNLGLRLNLTYYVYAKLAGGLYSRPGVASVSVMPIPADEDQQDRDIDVTWSAHPDEVDGYRIIRHKSYYSNWRARFDRQIDVTTGVLTTTDDVVTTSAVDVPAGELLALAAAGQVEAIPVGPLDVGSPPQTLNTLLVCRLASSRVGDIYLPVTTQNVDGEDETTYEPLPASAYGDTWFAPDHPGWLFPEKYVDINGRRYTLIFTTVNPLPEKVLVDVDGVETDGDGNGELIRKIVLQRLHFINNFIAPDTPYQSGSYLTAADTTFPQIPELPLVDEQSHYDADAILDERIEGGCEGAGIIGARGEWVSAADALAWFHVSADVDQAFNRKGQDTISAEPLAVPDAAPAVNDVVNIKDHTFSIIDQVQSAFFNILPYVHTRDYTGRSRTGWYGLGEERSQTSIDNYDQERESPRFELHFLRSSTAQGAATIAAVMQRKRARYQDPRRAGKLTMPFEGLNYEPGIVVAISAVEGIGANGWEGRHVRITRHEAYPTEGYIVLDFYDLELVLANLGSP